MSDYSEEVDMEFDRQSDVPPEKPVPVGFYEGVVSDVRFSTQGAGDNPYPGCQIARISYRIESTDPDLNGKRVQPFPIPVRGDKDSWKWFDWCKRMGYDVSIAFRFNPADVEGIRVGLKFDAPRAGKVGTKNEGKMYDNLVSVERLK
jgi:hypothetical protein